MPTAPGWPSTLYPRQVDPGTGRRVEPKTATLLQYPPPGNVLIASGATAQQKATIGGVLIVAIYANLPEGVRGFLQIDGQKVIDSQDGEGLVGVLVVGDPAVPYGLPGNAVEVEIVNGNASARTACFWLVCMAV